MEVSDVIVLPEGEHSPFGPSSADRWMNCPGSKSQGHTAYAAEGNAAHALSEWVRQGKPLASFKGKLIQVGAYEFKVGKAMMNSVQTFVDSVNAEGEGPALTEERVAYPELVPNGFGTTDHARLRDWLCRVKDFKHGKGVVVDAKDNAQLMLYALGVFFKYRWLYEFDRFLLSICQPRVRHFSEWEISLGHLLQWGYDVVRPAYKRALVSTERKAGPWCKFCGFKNECSERAAYKVAHETGVFKRDAEDELEALND
jgi:hypothetical protein